MPTKLWLKINYRFAVKRAPIQVDGTMGCNNGITRWKPVHRQHRNAIKVMGTEATLTRMADVTLHAEHASLPVHDRVLEAASSWIGDLNRW
jgi:hypothetical protein